MAFWNVDLTTQDGAESAAGVGGFACFIAAGLGAVGLGFGAVQLLSSGGTLAPAGMGAIAISIAETIFYLVAGLRLRAGKGVVLASVAAVLLGIELATKLFMATRMLSALSAPSFIIGIVITATLLVGVVTGVRGAMAVRRVALTPDQAGSVFE